MKVANLSSLLTILCLLSLMTIMDRSSCARILDDFGPKHNHHHYHKITFLMQNVLNVTQHPSPPKPATTKVTNQIPFSKPLGFLPPNGGIPLLPSNPSIPVAGSTETLDVSNLGISFPARATLQELEFGSLTEIDEDLYMFEGTGSLVAGKVKGVFVASSEDGTNHMVAMTGSFSRGGFKDGLRFFGVHKLDALESHIAVIGGTGKYEGANGYAVIRATDLPTGEENITDKLLLFNVYLS